MIKSSLVNRKSELNSETNFEKWETYFLNF